MHGPQWNAVEPMNDDLDNELNLTMVDGQVNPDGLAKFVRKAARLGLSGEDAAKLAAYK